MYNTEMTLYLLLSAIFFCIRFRSWARGQEVIIKNITIKEIKRRKNSFCHVVVFVKSDFPFL